jgi:hypothetical protein
MKYYLPILPPLIGLAILSEISREYVALDRYERRAPAASLPFRELDALRRQTAA